MRLRAVWVFVGLLASVGAARGEGTTTQPAKDVAPTVAMPEGVYRIFKAALERHVYSWPQWKAKNLAALEGLRAARWLDLEKLKLVRIHAAGEKGESGLAWVISSTEKELVVVTPELMVGRVDRAKVGKIEDADLAGAVDHYLKYAKSGNVEDWKTGGFNFISGVSAEGVPNYSYSVDTLLLAYAAAFRGRDVKAGALMESVLRSGEWRVTLAMDARAWPAMSKGVELLEKGAARKEVAAAWEAGLAACKGSTYEAEIREMLLQLKVQVAADDAAAKLPKVDVGKLSVEERVAYYGARLGDVHGEQFSDPGECDIFGAGAETEASDALVKIGRPSLAMLVGLLEDRRVTRSMGYHRTYDEHPTVLRYQDVAIACIESITRIEFYKRSSTGAYLSNEDGKVREAVVADVRKWWKEHGGESELKWQMSRLESGDIFRIATLHRVEELDAKAVDAAAILKGWADKARGTKNAAVDLPEVAMEFGLRGNFAMREEMRKMAKGVSDFRECGALIYLVQYGEAADFRYLLELSRKVADEGPTGFDSWIIHMIGDEVVKSDNSLSVPLLVFFLDQKEPYGIRGTPTGGVNFSLADECMERLIRWTGHDEKYEPDGPMEHRNIAIERWQAWWTKDGEKEFTGDHPEVKKVMEAGGGEK